MAHTITLINNSRFDENPKLLGLAKLLNVSTNYNDEDPKDSIMQFEKFCSCDSGFLCEHRLDKILDYVEENYSAK
jgi:hypothetical protein